jgi:uncharacterized protein YcfJ
MQREAPVKRIVLSLAAVPLLGACATDPYGNNVGNRTMGGMLVGGALGALAGSSIGLDPVSGAAAGMVAGGAAGYAIKGPVFRSRQYYKDTSGYCYYVDEAGVSQYDNPPVRC